MKCDGVSTLLILQSAITICLMRCSSGGRVEQEWPEYDYSPCPFPRIYCGRCGVMCSTLAIESTGHRFESLFRCWGLVGKGLSVIVERRLWTMAAIGIDGVRSFLARSTARLAIELFTLPRQKYGTPCRSTSHLRRHCRPSNGDEK